MFPTVLSVSVSPLHYFRSVLSSHPGVRVLAPSEIFDLFYSYPKRGLEGFPYVGTVLEVKSRRPEVFYYLNTTKF